MKVISASKTALLLGAPCSVPWYDATAWDASRSYAARAGQAIHKAHEDTINHGPRSGFDLDALAKSYGLTPRQATALHNQYRQLAAWAGPRIIDTARAEVKYALDPQTGEARELDAPGERDYSQAPAGWITGTVDVVQTYDDAPPWVADLKSGGLYVQPAAENPQLRTLGAMVAGVLDAPRVRLSVVRVSEQDAYETEPAVLDAFDLDDHVTLLGAAVERVRKDERDGAPPVAGEHCKRLWCPARSTCPAFALYEAESGRRTGT